MKTSKEVVSIDAVRKKIKEERDIQSGVDFLLKILGDIPLKAEYLGKDDTPQKMKGTYIRMIKEDILVALNVVEDVESLLPDHSYIQPLPRS